MFAEFLLLGMVCSFVVILLTSTPADDEKHWDRDRTLGFGRGRRRRVDSVDIETLLLEKIDFDPAAHLAPGPRRENSELVRVSRETDESYRSMDLIAFLNGTPAADRSTPEYLRA
ncbi:hypothetical protein [Nocardioides sp.]|uniref:hypothetical protein n=1 Tax=Nocardioides sp. TaxID=35761 RepID=UPI00356B16BC